MPVLSTITWWIGGIFAVVLTLVVTALLFILGSDEPDDLYLS